jgi:hypothetical protein
MRLLSIALLGLVTACKKDAEPASQPSLLVPPQATPASPAGAPADSRTLPSQLPVDVTWEDPPAFQRVPTNNPMRKATYRVPRAKGDSEDGELSVFYFGPGMGGSVDSNVDRWVKQFSGIKPEDVQRGDREANGLKQHTVHIASGTFSSGMPGGPTTPKPDFGLLGGIVQSPAGVYFFKLTGPRATVKAAHDPFYKLLDSVKTAG